MIADISQFSLMHLAYITTIFRNADENMSHVRTVTSLSHKALITSNLMRYKFFIERIQPVGHVIQPDRLDLGAYTTGAAPKLHPRRSLTGSKSFLNLRDVFRWFVSKFASISAWLDKKLKRRAKDVQCCYKGGA